MYRFTQSQSHQKNSAGGIWEVFKRLWPLALPVLLMAPSSLTFPYPSVESRYSDLVVTHYPNAVYLRNAILNWHTIPLWSPTILSGYPFFANPLSGLWYPPGWLALILPLPFGFNILIAAHLLWGGVGMYLLLRANRLAHRAALLGGLAFSMMPKLFAHYGAGHLTLLYAVPWTPWLLYFATIHRLPTNKFHAKPAIILALIFLADVRWVIYAGVIWWAYSLTQVNDRKSSFPRYRETATLLRQSIYAGLLAAPLALPLLEYTGLSTRAQMTSSDFFTFSFPPERLFGLIYPDLGGFHEWMIYFGAVILIFGVLAFVWDVSRQSGKFWLWVFVLSLVFSLGSNIPYLSILTRLPGISLLRVPSRALFLTGMAIVVLAAFGLDHLLSVRFSSKDKRRATLVITALAGFDLALAAGVWVLTGKLPLNFVWGVGAVLLGAIWIGIGLNRFQVAKLVRPVTVSIWFAGLLVLCLIDLSVVDRSLFAPREAGVVFAEGEDVAQFLASKTGDFRVYSPSYSLPQQTTIRYGLQLADGVDPLQLESYAIFMEKATGVPRTGYSVTIPPFLGDDPESANESYQPDPELLGLINARYIAAEFDLIVDDLILRQQYGETRLYENQLVRPRAWVQTDNEMNGLSVNPVEIIHWEANRIDIKAVGPGILVLSEIIYPGWRVWIDGVQSDIEEVEGLLRGVYLESGEHHVSFVFGTMSFYAGLALGVVGGLSLIFERFLRVK